MNPRFEMPDNLYFGGGLRETYMTPLALAILICGVFLTFVLPRKYVIVALLATGLVLPASISFVVAGFHFGALRILLLAGWLRVCLRREINFLRVNSLDKVILVWAVFGAVTFCVLWGSAAMANRVGFLYSTLGSYFLLRVLILDKADVVRMLATLAIVLSLLTPFVLQERVTGHNPLSIVGAPERSTERYGDVRAQGPFLHPVICGTVAAMMLPPFVALWWQGGRNRWYAITGVLASAVMTFASSSSTPAMTLGAGLIGLLLWRVRRHLRQLRWAVVIALLGLQLLMKAPVWFLIAHVGNSTGGSGWHRATLIDTFVRHIGEWWLFGTRNNADWGYYMWDVDNAFVNNGIQGGILTFVLFIAVFVYAFKLIGNARKRAESASDARLIWSAGCALFANIVAFFGIFYFDQSILAWYGLLAMIAATGNLSVYRRRAESTPADDQSDVLLTNPAESEIPIGIPLLQR